MQPHVTSGAAWARRAIIHARMRFFHPHAFLPQHTFAHSTTCFEGPIEVELELSSQAKQARIAITRWARSACLKNAIV